MNYYTIMENNPNHAGMPPSVPAEYLVNERGGQKLIDPEGFTYHVSKKQDNGRVLWVCDNRRKCPKCYARACTEGELIVSRSGEHTHTADARQRELCNVRRIAKEEAKKGTQSTAQCLVKAKESVPASVLGAINDASLTRSIRQWRVLENVGIPNPANLADIAIPDAVKYRKGPGGEDERFLLHDSGAADPTRFLIFGTHRGLDFMQSAEDWYLDGTFRISPTIFAQVYSLSVARFNQTVPILYALLPSKSEDQYDKLMAWVKANAPQANPVTCMTDFEAAPIKSILRAYPNVGPTGCFFHLTQNIWKHVKATPGMQEKYNTDPDYANQVRQLAALAFYPSDMIADKFEELTDPLFGALPEEMQPVIDYFEDNYVGRLTPAGRRAPRFPPRLWSQYNRVINNKHRANNCVEAHHGAMDRILSMKHPSIWRLIEGLKALQVKADGEMERLIAGQDPRPPCKKYKDVSKHIKSIVDTMTERTTLEFLRGIAHNFNMQV